MTARRDFHVLQTKTQANSLVRLGCDVVESTFDTWGYFFATKMP